MRPLRPGGFSAGLRWSIKIRALRVIDLLSSLFARAQRARELYLLRKGTRTLVFEHFFDLSPRRSLHCSTQPAPHYACRSGARRTTHAAGTKPATAHRAEDRDLSSVFWMVLGSFAIDPAQENKGKLAELQKQIIFQCFSRKYMKMNLFLRLGQVFPCSLERGQ